MPGCGWWGHHLFLEFNKLASKSPLVIHFVWTTGALDMNLWLSPHGIWYYRKITTLPCGRRKEIKKSLHTRDKLCARHKVTQLLACVRSRAKPIQLHADVTVDPQEQSVAQPTTPAAKPLE